MPPPRFPPSLVKYNNPFVVDSCPTNKDSTRCSTNDKKNHVINSNTMQAVLNSMLPPRSLIIDDHQQQRQTWMQYVSSIPATHREVIRLTEILESRLLEHKQNDEIKERGYCPIRHGYYSQCFDEIIRQVTIQCLERGTLLFRMKKDLQRTIKAYRELYQSSTRYGITKLCRRENDLKILSDEYEYLTKRKTALENQICDLRKQRKEKRLSYDLWVKESFDNHDKEIQRLKSFNQSMVEKLKDNNTAQAT